MRDIPGVILAVLIGMVSTVFGVTDQTVAFIKEVEGFRASAYTDGSQSSIGYGTSVNYARAHGVSWRVVTRQQAESLLRTRLCEDFEALLKKMPNLRSAPSSVQIAILSVYYNCPAIVGPRVVRFTNNKDWESLSYEIAYNYDPGNLIGLVNRHVREANLIRSQLGYPALGYPRTINEHANLRRAWKARMS